MPPRDAEIEAAKEAAREEGRQIGKLEGGLSEFRAIVTEQSRQIDLIFKIQRDCKEKNCDPLGPRLAVVESSLKSVVEKMPDLSKKTTVLWFIALGVLFMLQVFGPKIASSIWPDKPVPVVFPTPLRSSSKPPQSPPVSGLDKSDLRSN